MASSIAAKPINERFNTSVEIQHSNFWQLEVNERLSEGHKNICIDISAAPRKIGAKFPGSEYSKKTE